MQKSNRRSLGRQALARALRGKARVHSLDLGRRSWIVERRPTPLQASLDHRCALFARQDRAASRQRPSAPHPAPEGHGLLGGERDRRGATRGERTRLARARESTHHRAGRDRVRRCGARRHAGDRRCCRDRAGWGSGGRLRVGRRCTSREQHDDDGAAYAVTDSNDVHASPPGARPTSVVIESQDTRLGIRRAPSCHGCALL